MHDPVANDGHMAAWNLNKVEFGSFGLVSRRIREVRLQNGERELQLVHQPIGRQWPEADLKLTA